MSGALPPAHDLAAEAAVLSAVMIAPDVLDEVRVPLRAEYFYADANRMIFAAMLECDGQGCSIDIITLARKLQESGNLQRCGGTPYLAEVSDKTPAVSHATTHAKIVADKWRQRRMVETLRRLAGEGHALEGDVEEWLQLVEQAVFVASECGRVGDAPESVGEIAGRVVAEAVDRNNGVASSAGGVPSGFLELDNNIGGFKASLLYVLAARPGMGKSALALSMALNVARQSNTLVVFISLEMPKDQLAARAIASEARVSVGKVLNDVIGDDEWNAVAAAMSSLGDVPLVIEYRPGATVPEVRSIARRALREMRKTRGPDLKLGMVIVDYLQLMGGNRQKGDTRETEVSGISRDLTRMAGELECPVLALSQLNRSLESRPNKRPQLSDLRESGAIEQDAYAILFLYRDEYYKKDSAQRGVAEVIIAKNRNGRTGQVNLMFAGEYTRFDNLQNDYDFGDFGDEWDG